MKNIKKKNTKRFEKVIGLYKIGDSWIFTEDYNYLNDFHILNKPWGETSRCCHILCNKKNINTAKNILKEFVIIKLELEKSYLNIDIEKVKNLK
jgi:hypothetical protein